MYYIFSKNKVTSLVLQPAKIDKEGNISQEPIRIVFTDGFYQTEDEDILNRFKKLKNWGVEYCLVDKPVTTVAPSPNITVARMETPEEKLDARIAKLESNIAQVTNTIGELGKYLAKKEKSEKKEEKETKKEE